MRNLASIQLIESVEPIPGADAIEKLRVLGWNVVAKKGEHKPGDKVVYCEIDSLLPEREEFEFLRKCYKPALVTGSGAIILPAGFRIKTIKLRGQVSQGICFPLSILPPDAPTEVGADVTDVLGVVKYELPEDFGGSNGPNRPRISNFPGFLRKTDETRIQSMKGVLEQFRGEEFIATEKLDGSSFTAFVRDGEFGICSRNNLLDLEDVSHPFVALAGRLGLKEKMLALSERIAIQGEVIGPKIQGNKYGLTKHKLLLFDVYDHVSGRYSMPYMAYSVAERFGLQFVPVVEPGPFVLNHTVDQLVEMAQGKSLINPAVEREGIVVRPTNGMLDERGNRLSFKVINPRFLLEYDE